MARDGTGNYVAPEAPVTTGTPISSTGYNASLSDIGTALTDSLARDGQGGMLGNLPMGNNRITGLANATDNTDAAALGQIAMPFLSTVTVTGTPTYVEFALPATYNAYEIQFNNVTPTANGSLFGQFSRDGGGTWVTGSGQYTSGWYGSISPGFGTAVSAVQASLSFSITSSAAGPLRGVMRLSLPSATGSARWTCETSANNNATGLWEAATYHGVLNSGTRPDRIRLYWFAGTWSDQGTVTLRGVRA
jgi:hypothetical protein